MKFKVYLTSLNRIRENSDINCFVFGRAIIYEPHGLAKYMYEGHLESKERFAIQRYLLIIGKKNNMQVL